MASESLLLFHECFGSQLRFLLRERLRRGINFFEHETNHLWVRDSGQGNDRLLALSTTSLPLFVRVC